VVSKLVCEAVKSGQEIARNRGSNTWSPVPLCITFILNIQNNNTDWMSKESRWPQLWL